MEKSLKNTFNFESINGQYQFCIYDDENALPQYKLVKFIGQNDQTVKNIYKELQLLNAEFQLGID